jgi:hypothetical protein
MPKKKTDKDESYKYKMDAEDILGTFLKGDRVDDDERYKQSVENIYRKLKPIWLSECKDAVWLLQDDYVRQVAEILYLDDQMGGNLSPDSLSMERQNLLGWKQVQSVIERYRAEDYSLVDNDRIKAILSSIIKNKQARDADRLKAIEMYTGMFSSGDVEGITFINDLYVGKSDKSKKEEDK